MPEFVFHLIGNAHLDPVWLWDWRDGMNEGLITCRTILDLMDEDPELTFIRGEASIYQHIEAIDPMTFSRIVKRVREGRWDYVGGTMIQPDTNMPATESFLRQYLHGQEYFRKTFGRPVTAAWAADSFGHAAGLPDVLASAGITSFAFTRPFADALPLAKPAFWWEGPGGSQILSYRPMFGWYGSERDEINKRLDGLLTEARKYDLTNVGVFWGLGNHGGGPTRRQLADIRAWAAAHPQIKFVHSGLHRFFAALGAEVKNNGRAFLPVQHGEMNFCCRGCYASVAKFKFAYRKTEAMALCSEKTDTVISAAQGRKPANTHDVWDAILFNGFHDILPGSSIERAYEDQLAWLGGAQHQASKIELAALNALASEVDTRVRKPAGDHPSGVAVMVWNPHPRPFHGPVQLEACLEYRPIFPYQNRSSELPVELLGPDGKMRRFQVVPHEHAFSTDTPWRKRVVTPMTIPAFGWSMLEFGWVEGTRPAPAPARPATSPRKGVIQNEFYRVEVAAGKSGIQIFHGKKRIFGGKGLSAGVFEDQGGSWGGSADGPKALKQVKRLETWKVQKVEMLEKGPERATLWVRLAGKNSWMTLLISLYAEREAVDIAARVLWNERSARLKLVMPGFRKAEFEVPGAVVQRGESGEVPGGRWVRALGAGRRVGFASDSLYGFDCTSGEFRATVARASRYADGSKAAADERPWRPVVDCGELKFRFLINPGDAALPRLAEELEQPPVMVLAPPHDGRLPRSGSLASLEPKSLQLLALKAAEDGKGLILRVRNTGQATAKPVLTWLGKPLPLAQVKGQAIASWQLERTKAGWKARATTTLED